MTTSRTGTTKWKAVRAHAIKEAKANGQTQCPYCKVTLNYDDGRMATSAWVDHIVPHSRGGQDVASNAVVCCRTCNISKGNRDAPKAPQARSLPFISPRW